MNFWTLSSNLFLKRSTNMPDIVDVAAKHETVELFMLLKSTDS